MAKAYRSRSRLALDLMLALSQEGGSAHVSRLLLLANLTHARLKEHADQMLAKGWIEESEEDGRKIVALTSKGHAVLRELQKIDEAMADFGLVL